MSEKREREREPGSKNDKGGAHDVNAPAPTHAHTGRTDKRSRGIIFLETTLLRNF